MKKIKAIIISLLCIVILTGCQKEYKLIISDDKIVEEFDALIPYNEENEKRVMPSYFPLHANNDEVYNKKITKENDMLKFHLDYTYKPKEITNSNLITECFAKREMIVDNDKYYYFKLEEFQDCLTDYNVDINIITDNKVYKNNADKVDGNKYTWNLRDSNKDSFNIEIKIAKGVKRNQDIIVFVSIAALISVIVIIFLVVSSKRKKSNKI